MTDYSIASKVVPPSFDPLKTIGAAQGVQQGMLQNRLLGQNVAQTLAQRAAAQASIDPATGQADPDKYESALAAGGASPEALLQAQQQRQLALQTKISQLGLTKDQMALSAQELGNGAMVAQGVLANGTKDPTALSKASISAAIENNLLQPGLVKSPEGIAHAKALEGMMGDDPQKNAALLQQFVNQSTDITKAMGAVTNVTTPKAIVQQRINPATGDPTYSGAIPVGLAPSQLAQTVTVIDPQTKEQRTTTLGALLGQPIGGAPPAAGSAKNGRYPGGGGNQLEAPGGVQTGLAPGTSEAMTGSANTYLADQAAVPNLKRTLTTFDQGYAAMKNATTGPASERLQNLRGIADTYGIPLPKGIGNKDETVAYAEANKWMTSALTSEAQRLGLSTDAARTLQGEAQPGVHTVKDAAMAMIPVLKGLKAMDLVAPVIAQKQGWTPQEYVEKRAQWANSVDPLAFGADLMPKAQRQAIIAGLKTPDQRAKYARGLRDAEAAGLFTIKDLAN